MAVGPEEGRLLGLAGLFPEVDRLLGLVVGFGVGVMLAIGHVVWQVSSYSFYSLHL